MACSCNTRTNAVPDSPENGEIANVVDFQAYEAFGINTAIDGTKAFWGVLTQDARADLVIVSSERAGITVTLRLRPLAQNSIKRHERFKAGDFVFGAYKPDSIFQNEDNATQSLGEIAVDGTLLTIDPSVFSPSLLMEQARLDQLKGIFKGETRADDESEADLVSRDDVFGALGIAEEGRMRRILFRFADAGRTVILDGRDVIEIYALINSAFTYEMALNLALLFEDGFVLGRVDAVPCRPGVQTGQVFAVWRLYQPQTAERRTLIQRVDLRKIEDVHVERYLVVDAPPVDSVDPEKWDAEFCSRCRRSCAKLFLECLKVSQGMTGPEAAKKYKECLDEAQRCYEQCFC